MPPTVTVGVQFKLSNSPSNTISAVHFQPGLCSQLLLASAWDCTLRLYDVTSGGQRSLVAHSTPILTSCFTDAAHALSGCLDGAFNYVDCNTNQVTTLGRCLRAVSTSLYSKTIQAAVSGSWDKTVRIWDPRSSGSGDMGDSTGGAVSFHKQPDTVYTMDSVENRLVVGTAGRHVLIWDLRQMGAPLDQQESTLRYQTRCIRCFPNGQGYVLSSIEGRVAVRMFENTPEMQKKCYVFKCHRLKEENKEIIHPVTAIAFHQRYNTFATGGSDGVVNTWDGFNRKWLAQYEKYTTTISSLDFSEEGTQLAVASSYIFERGQLSEEPESAIFIRTVADSEVRRKQVAPTIGAPK